MIYKALGIGFSHSYVLLRTGSRKQIGTTHNATLVVGYPHSSSCQAADESIAELKG